MTRVALVTTTIHVPTAWAQAWAQALPAAAWYIVGDRKSDDGALRHLAASLGEAHYYPYGDNRLARYRCEPCIGPDSVSRRNLGLLEALRAGADVLVCLDDDNWPLDDWAAGVATFAAEGPVYGRQGYSADGWFNMGCFANEPHVQRGLPRHLFTEDGTRLGGETAGRLGVQQCLVLGDPDISAVERMVNAPQVTQYRRDQFALCDPKTTWTAINSQATLWRRETAALAFMLAGAQRYDDIWAGYIAQHVLSATDYVVGLGQPYVRQDRNTDHDLLTDLNAELHGMRYTERFCAALKAIPLDPSTSIGANLRQVALGLNLRDARTPGWTAQMSNFLHAWIGDVTEVLG